MIFCDQDDIANVLSQSGISLRVDDVPPDTLGEVIERASAIGTQFCGQIYSESNLADNVFFKYMVTDIAAFFLCERRGNAVPSPIFRKYNFAMEMLRLIMNGSMRLTGTASKASNAPTVTNQRIVLRPHMRTVTERRKSSDTPPAFNPKNNDPYDSSFNDTDWVI